MRSANGDDNRFNLYSNFNNDCWWLRFFCFGSRFYESWSIYTYCHSFCTTCPLRNQKNLPLVELISRAGEKHRKLLPLPLPSFQNPVNNRWGHHDGEEYMSCIDPDQQPYQDADQYDNQGNQPDGPVGGHCRRFFDNFQAAAAVNLV